MLDTIRSILNLLFGRINTAHFEMIFLHVERLGAVGIVIVMAAGAFDVSIVFLFSLLFSR